MNPIVGMSASRLKDFMKMMPQEFNGSKVEEDTQVIIYLLL